VSRLDSSAAKSASSAAESAEQLKRISANHTTPEQAGEVFTRVKPKLAVYNHLLLFGGATAEDLIPATRKKYSGPLAVGVDLLQIDIGESVEARPFREQK
jgi:ribonuclease Z